MNYGQQINLFHVFVGILFLVVSFAALQGRRLPRFLPIAAILLAGGALAYHGVSLVRSWIPASQGIERDEAAEDQKKIRRRRRTLEVRDCNFFRAHASNAVSDCSQLTNEK